MTLPEIRRALLVLDRMTNSIDPATRAWARQVQRDAATPGVKVEEILAPIWQRPLVQLTTHERTLRLMAA